MNLSDTDKEWLSDLVVKSHTERARTQTVLNKELSDRISGMEEKLDDSKALLKENTDRTNEMYKYLTTSKTLWDAITVIGNWIIRLSVVGAALTGLHMLYYKFFPK